MRLLILSLAVILAVVLQATWLAGLHFPWQVTPDLVLIMVIAIGLLRGPDEGLIFGLAAGFFVDLLSGGIIGIQAVTKMAAGFSIGLLEKTIFKDNLVLPTLAVFGATVVLETFHIIMYQAFNANYHLSLTFFTLILPMALYNAVLTPPLYFGVLKLDRYAAERA